jgi:hypothetical protein
MKEWELDLSRRKPQKVSAIGICLLATIGLLGSQQAWALQDECSLTCKPREILDPVTCECIPLDGLPVMPHCMLVCTEPGQVLDPFHCRCVSEGALSDVLQRMKKKERP